MVWTIWPGRSIFPLWETLIAREAVDQPRFDLAGVSFREIHIRERKWHNSIRLLI